MGWSQTFHALCNIGITVTVILVSHLYHVKADVVANNADNSSVRFASMPSNFGMRIPSDGLVGFLVSADPYDGCSQIAPPPDTNHTMQATYIALIRRNDCDFDEKVLNAQRAGYLGAIVHNVGSNGLVPMSGAKYAGQVFIPSVFVGEHDGLKLASEFNYTTGSPVKITPGFVFPYHIYLIPFASIVGVCFILMVGFMIAKYVRDRRRLRRARLSRDHLKKLPIKKFKKGDDYDVCAICLDEYEDGDKLRILPCNHAFHSKCVDPWLTNNRRTCPVCKRKVVPNGVEDSSDDDSSDEEDGPNENTPLLTASNNASSGGATGEDRSETTASPPSPKTTHVDASTAMTPAEDSDEESAGSSSDNYEMAHAHHGGVAGSSQPLQPVTEIQIEHEVVVERPDETDDSDDEFIDDENARLQKV